jgi:uncharacterized protein (TIRG00374 family)
MVEDWRATAAGFAGAAVVLGVLLWFVGVGEILTALEAANPPLLALVAGMALAWLLAWGLALRTVLAVLGIELSVRESFMVFSAATFANNVTPFGQAGGEPFSALLISRVADSEYETGLAAIASVDALNFVPSIGLAAVGLGYYATTATLGDRLTVAAASIGGLAVAVAVGAGLGWRYRYRLEAGVVRVFTPFVEWVGRAIPGRDAPDGEDVAGRIEGFFSTIERIGGDRRSLVLALGLSTAGWVALAACLWLALFAIGVQVPVAAPMIAIPAAAVMSVTPLPGALGAIEAVQVGLLLPMTGLSKGTIGAAVLIHRGATYWLPVLIGGGSASALGVSRR